MNTNMKQIAKQTSKDGKIILKDLVNSLEALNFLSLQKLPVFVSFKLSLFMKNASAIIEVYEQERNKLIEELGKPVIGEDNKPTGNFKFEDENAKKFNETINGLLEQSVEIVIPEIKINELNGITIEPKYLIPLTWLIKE